MPSDSLYVLTVLCVIVVISEVLVRRTALRYLGTAVLVILVTALVANLGILPAGSTAENPVPVYDGIFAYLAPLAIFWILLRVNLRSVLQAGLPMVVLFLIGSAGTTLGVLVGMAAVAGPDTIGPLYAAVGGMFTGTYTGGSINFNAVALHYDVVREGVLYAGSVVVDNIATTVWMVATLALPRLLAPLWPRKVSGASAPDGPLEPVRVPDLGIDEDTEAIHPIDLGIVFALGFASLWISNALAPLTGIPSILILTVLALAIAQLPPVTRLRGAQTLGMFAVYLFLAVIGAFCDVRAMADLGQLGVVLLGFATITVLVHGAVILLAARLMRIDLDLAAVASQANVGGGTSALALARSIGRSDLVLPAVLLGALGNGLGTFLGFWAAGYLLPTLLG